MPELPEVEVIVRGLRDDVVGRAFTAVTTNWSRQIVGMPPQTFADRLVGQRIKALRRRGKYVVFDLSGDVLLIHLKMTGRLYVAGPARDRFEDDRWVRAVFGLDDGRELRFSDSRKFGRLHLVVREEEVTGALGPEPLSDAFTPDAFRQLIAGRRGAVKPLLMNQHFIAGIGNIYADEALWQARIDPRRKVDTLKPEDVERLYHALRTVLAEGIEHEGASVNWYRKPDGTTGAYQNRFNVYDQEGEPCPRCGSPINKIRLGQRGTHLCPVCQT
jgi:formamidopyrimidine-DNA glycosylase